MNMYRRLVFLFILVTTIVLTSFEVLAEDAERHQSVAGLEVYLGVLPAELVSDPAAFHEGEQRKKHRYHVMVALFDSNTGERITDAKVKATVTILGLTGTTRKLEPMPDELVSYGNYFRLPKPGIYRIQVKIRRPGAGSASVAGFVYKRPQD